MTLVEIKNLLEARLVCGEELDNKTVDDACATDMMSCILAHGEGVSALITGLNNAQVVRTAEMLDVCCIICVRGMSPCDEMVEMAKKCGIVILQTQKTMFRTCGVLYENGVGKIGE